MAVTKEQKAAIARINGSKSRGPKTSEGKAISSQTALKHGLTARKLIVTALESEDEYRKFDARMRSFYRPTNPMEALWVNRIVTSLWRVRRANYEEASRIDEENARNLGGEHYIIQNQAKSEAILNYEEKIMKQVQLAIRELEKLRAPSSPLSAVVDLTPSPRINFSPRSHSLEE